MRKSKNSPRRSPFDRILSRDTGSPTMRDTQGKQFTKLIIETYILFKDKTFNVLKTEYEPEELRSRFHGDCFSLEVVSAETLSEEAFAIWDTENPDNDAICSRYGSHYYKYKSTTSELIYGD